MEKTTNSVNNTKITQIFINRKQKQLKGYDDTTTTTKTTITAISLNTHMVVTRVYTKTNI